jgi:hypothetical protein
MVASNVLQAEHLCKDGTHDILLTDIPRNTSVDDPLYRDLCEQYAAHRAATGGRDP